LQKSGNVVAGALPTGRVSALVLVLVVLMLADEDSDGDDDDEK
jgi:hypothetical protein